MNLGATLLFLGSTLPFLGSFALSSLYGSRVSTLFFLGPTLPFLGPFALSALYESRVAPALLRADPAFLKVVRLAISL